MSRDIKITFPENVKRIISILSGNGEEAYAVGGCIRDSVMGKTPADWDITTSRTPDEMTEIFESVGLKTVPTGLRHGTVTVLADNTPYECTTFRIEEGYKDSRHPDKVSFTKRLADDLCRRDFTVNAMACAPDGDLIDLYGGMDDIKNKTVRCVGDPEKRFSEDALRILRALRFAAVLGFEIEKETLAACKRLSSGLSRVSAERKAVELKKLLLSDSPTYGVGLLLSTGVGEYVLPGMKASEVELEALPKKFEVRLAALICSSPDADPGSLKLSSRELREIALLRDAPCLDCSPQNARRLMQKYGELARDASLLYGNPELARLIELEEAKRPCVTLSSLAINGKDLSALGISGKATGEVLKILLDLVIDSPEMNDTDSLLAYAANYYATKSV